MRIALSTGWAVLIIASIVVSLQISELAPKWLLVALPPIVIWFVTLRSAYGATARLTAGIHTAVAGTFAASIVAREHALLPAAALLVAAGLASVLLMRPTTSRPRLARVALLLLPLAVSALSVILMWEPLFAPRTVPV